MHVAKMGMLQPRWLGTGHVATMAMLGLNIGSGMLRLISCMLRLSCLASSVQGGHPPPILPPGLLGPMTRDDEVRPSLSMHELSMSMPEPILSLSVLILAAHPEVWGYCNSKT